MSVALHLLIVDDQPESLAGLAGQLEDRGHRVEVSADPMEALRLIADAQTRRDTFGLLIVDVNLPGLDGPGLVRELRRRGDLTPTIFVTGYHSVATRLRGELGPMRVSGLLTKPVPMAELERLLELAARQSRSSTQDRRSSEFGLGSGGHQSIGSGGHPLVGNVPGPTATGGEEPFYGTSRSFRAKFVTPAPTEGILSRVQKPPADNDIIPDTVVTGQFRQAPPPTPPSIGASGVRRGVRTPLPMPGQPPPGQRPPSGSSDALQRRGDFTPLGSPMIGFRDPVTGNYKRTPSGLHAPLEHNPREPRLPGTPAPPPDPNRPGTTSRYRRTVDTNAPGTPPAPPQTARQQTNPITSRIRRGLGLNPPAPPPDTEMPTCAVACAHCQGEFNVLIKPSAYTVLCVHCGQLNRIDPL